ncbi:pilin [Candidatus Saccharibacteria bacterium]|nr:pilin [Candidatus Saccharibacteria bacterium]
MKLKTILLAFFTPLLLVASAGSAQAQFNPLSSACKKAPNSPTCQQNNKQNGKSTNPTVDIIKTAANIIAVIAGIGAVVVIIISGFMFVTAGGASPGQRGGDPNRIKSARATLIGAIIGLVIVALAWTIVTFVTDKLVKA